MNGGACASASFFSQWWRLGPALGFGRLTVSAEVTSRMIVRRFVVYVIGCALVLAKLVSSSGKFYTGSI